MSPSLARCLCIFGTASDVGKSMITAGLGRLLSDAGVDVVPFKAQNLSNNSDVTLAGGEMARAQVLQAWACRATPHVDMNPVLLKPVIGSAAEVVVLGRARGRREAGAYLAESSALAHEAMQSLARLRARHRVVLVEGAGSCAELNLRDREFANFAVAHASKAPVLLVADIERGGIFGQVVGTLTVMSEADRACVRGILVNKFRGDSRFFDDGRRILEQKTGLPVVGVVPYLHGLGLDAEDGVVLDGRVDPPFGADADVAVRIAVIRLPHLSNFTDFDPLLRSGHVGLHFLERPRALADYRLVVLPGSKAVRRDLEWLRASGWHDRLLAYRADGGRILGICGGYQLLGDTLVDPGGQEGPPGTSRGLGLLAATTTFHPEKFLSRSRGFCACFRAELHGYEIHRGRTESRETRRFLEGVERLHQEGAHAEGAVSADNRVAGTYLHGLFEAPEALQGLFRWLEASEGPSPRAPLEPTRERTLDLWAQHLRAHVDVAWIASLVGEVLPRESY